MKHILLFLFCLCSLHIAARQRPDTASRHRSDSGLVRQRPGFADSLLEKLEHMQQTLSRINNTTEEGFNTADIEVELPYIQSNIQIIQENLSLYSSVLNMKNLLTFETLMQDMQQRLSRWRNALSSYNRELVGMQMEMRGLYRDDILRQLRKDSLLQQLYTDELDDIRQNSRLARTAARSNMKRIRELQAAVSKNYFALLELQDEVDDRLRSASAKTFSKEYNYIWQVADSNKRDVRVMELARKSYRGQQHLLGYYFREHQDNWVWMLLIALVYFIWVFAAFRRIKRAGQQQLITEASFKYIKPVPVISALVVAFNLAPFFDLRPPSAYVEIMQFFLLLSLTALFWRNWPRRLFYYWIVIMVFYLLFSFTNSIITPDLSTRIWLLVLNIAAIAFGMLFLPRIREELPVKRFIRLVSSIYIFLNLLAALCNIAGRISIARVFGTAAIYGLVQIIGLAVFIQVISEAFYLQMLSSKADEQAQKSIFNYERIQEKLNKLLSIGVVVCWVIIFITNLNLYNVFLETFLQVLHAPHKIGSTSFTFGNIIMLVVIIYLANLLQKYIGYFFGETEDGFGGEITRRGTRLVMIRLCVLIVGFLMAIAATGLPIDKITIVLGALGVGIGLGLQNIVNNLVSGIVLIFERPLQLGDYVEVADKKGRVKDIGIRASRLITTDGAEIVVPNGDLLSGQLTNWTLSNNHIRLELEIGISPMEEHPAAKEAILKTLQAHPHVMQKMPVEILFSNISSEQCTLLVHCWIANIANEHTVRSELLFNVYEALKEKGITMQ
jgi:small-conductance mechanosensitive channel